MRHNSCSEFLGLSFSTSQMDVPGKPPKCVPERQTNEMPE